MSLKRAFKAFFKAFKEPEKEEKKLDGEYPHLRLLALLQKSGRLIDFLKEDISQFNDAQVGAAVRQIHSECGRSLEELVTLRPMMQEAEGATISVPQGYDPAEIKVVGKVKGNPPYEGILRHKGWKAHKLSLPKSGAEGDCAIICPAEVEVR